MDDAVQLAEGRQGGGSHPDNEILVDEAVVLWVGVQLVNRPAPIHRLGRTWEISSDEEERLFFKLPSESLIIDHF